MNNNWTYAIIVLIAILIALGGGYYMGLEQGSITNSGTTSNTASSSVAIDPASVTVKYIYITVPGTASQVAQPIVTLPPAAHAASMTVKGEFFTADVVYSGSASVDENVYHFDDMLSASYSERGQVIKPMSWWDYLVQYSGWAALTLFVIFKG